MIALILGTIIKILLTIFIVVSAIVLVILIIAYAQIKYSKDDDERY